MLLCPLLVKGPVEDHTLLQQMLLVCVFLFCIKNELFNSTRSGDCVAVLNKVLLRVK